MIIFHVSHLLNNTKWKYCYHHFLFGPQLIKRLSAYFANGHSMLSTPVCSRPVTGVKHNKWTGEYLNGRPLSVAGFFILLCQKFALFWCGQFWVCLRRLLRPPLSFIWPILFKKMKKKVCKKIQVGGVSAFFMFPNLFLVVMGKCVPI